MIEPPGEPWIRRIFEIDYGVFVAVKQAVVEDLRGAVGHAGVDEFGIRVNGAAVEAAEESSGSRAVETVIVIEDSYAHSFPQMFSG